MALILDNIRVVYQEKVNDCIYNLEQIILYAYTIGVLCSVQYILKIYTEYTFYL